MIRTALFAAVAALSLGSSAALAAQGLDGDNNQVPGASTLVNHPVSSLERSFAGPYRQAAPVGIPDRAYFDRHTQID